jgi:hypothetical protein
MLFDLQGPRKTAVKVIYLGLAILMGGGLILFGIGSDVNGGLADVFGNKGSQAAAQDNVDKYSKQVAADPKNVKALQNLIAARYTLAGDPVNYNQKKNTFTTEGKQQLKQLTGDWKTYLKLTDNKPNIGTANFAVSGYLGLQDAEGATAAQQVITEKQPTAANYLALMLYASYAGKQLIASGAEVKALEVATKDELPDVKQQIKEIKTQLADRNKEVQKQIQQQFAQQAEQKLQGGTPGNPFGGLGSGGAAQGTAPPAK